MTAIRRHPWATLLFVGLAVLLGAVALTSEEPGSMMVGSVVLWVGVFLVYLFLAWVFRLLFQRDRSGEVERRSPVYAPPPLPYAMMPSRVPAVAHVEPVSPAALPASPLAPVAALAPSLGDVLMLTPGQFEELTVETLRAIGYQEVERTGGAGDLGADVVCRDPGGRATIVQCKRYAPGSTVGTPVIQTFIGMMHVHHRAERGIVVTTSGYSQPAVELAKRHGIALIGGGELLLLLHLTGVRLAEAVPVVGAPAATTVCSRCGQGNAAGDRFCTRCGTAVGAGIASAAASGMMVQCPRCKTMVPAAVRFCTSCGLARTVAPT